MLVIKKKTLVAVAVGLCILVTFIVCCSALMAEPATGGGSDAMTVVIDAGHGGIDGGVVGSSGVKESDLNLEISKRLRRCFEDAGFRVVMTRQTGGGLYGVATNGFKKRDMQKRKEIIEKARPNAVISVHLNRFSQSSRRGAQVFFEQANEQGRNLALALQKSFNEMEEAVRECRALTGDYYILNCTDYPAVIAECGFLSNSEDEKLLIDADYQEKLAYAIFKGTVDYLSGTTETGFFGN